MIDQFPDLLTQISAAESERSAALCSRLADTFEDDLLEHDGFPDAHLNFFLALLSKKQYYDKPGVWNFILAVNNSRDALTSAQCERITTAFIDNFAAYQDKDLCFAVCDFVARNLESFKASDLLQQLKRLELQKAADLRGYADEGLYILGQEIKRAARNATN
ncbi:hypothetical protein ACEN8I_01910 [Polaromonas sp. CT11-55]|uniref:hypothetical protein n=1 Tax=Polaromonas sp. CT11-55 TaxID=3243045 RepID=UPI0039A4FEBA